MRLRYWQAFVCCCGEVRTKQLRDEPLEVILVRLVRRRRRRWHNTGPQGRFVPAHRRAAHDIETLLGREAGESRLNAARDNVNEARTEGAQLTRHPVAAPGGMDCTAPPF